MALSLHDGGEEPELDIFHLPAFLPFQKTVYGEMKQFRAIGLGAASKRAEILTYNDEEKMWSQEYVDYILLRKARRTTTICEMEIL